MAEASSPFLATKRYAVVTGSNKGIGLEVCRQLASQGVITVLTSRDEKRGLEAFQTLKKSTGIHSDNLEFHQLDVTDPNNVASLAHFIRKKFGKLDILVNNAGVIGVITDFEAIATAGFPYAQVNRIADMMTQTYEMAEECFETNYYGAKRAFEVLLPLLKLSDSPRVINLSSTVGMLNNISNQEIRGILGNVENLTEEKIEEIVNQFLKDFKDGSYVERGWPSTFSAYSISKVAVTAYTRIMAKKYPSVIINCLCPGYVNTDLNANTGLVPIEEGGTSVVALLPHGSPSGLFYRKTEISSFE